ncbi:MAG: hypothetical protein F6K19_36935 [Cyanothece sp. SIO1E1]|nr:hypothetical protein [Cyanothece sp. SIO1E1]
MTHHHFSLPVENPRHTAQVLAELWGGKVVRGAANSDHYTITAFNQHGTLIEVCPAAAELTSSESRGKVKLAQPTFNC